jgi:uncharacterized protein YrzB (UPF0473 family)
MDENEFVELLDENNKPVKFERLLTFEYGESIYVALTPVEDFEGIENGEVILLEIREDEDEHDCYLPLENEQELEQVFNEFERLYYE